MGGFPGLGDEFGPYSIVRQLGRGGMGVVFEARDGRLGRSVALKVLSPFLSEDDAFRARFTHEAGVLARLDSAHVVQIHEYGEIDGCLYLTAQLVRGGDLEQHLVSEGRLGPVAALDLAEQVCEALVDAHEVGVVHRDIKPSNILLRRRDARLHAFLCDFGIATTADSHHTRTGQVVGSPLYMAPERHRGGRADIRGDIYAVGCVLWRMLTGLHPYPGNDVQVGMAHLQDPIPQLPETDAVSRAVNAVLLRALAKDPEDRYQNPAALRAAVAETLALARALAGPAVDPAPAERVSARAEQRARSATGAAPTVATGVPAGDGGADPVPAGEVTDVARVPVQRAPAPADHVDVGAPPDRTVVDAASSGTGRRRRPRVLVAAALAVALVVGGAAVLLTRGSGEPTPGPGKDPAGPTTLSPAPLVAPALVRPSDVRGGTVHMALAGVFQDGTVDPGGLYSSYEWNLSRLYARTLMMVDPAPTAPGNELVPDLATGPGTPSRKGQDWTYTLREGLTYEDGSPITAEDVKYAVLRSTDASRFPNAPTYFATLLDLPKGWTGPGDSPSGAGDAAISTKGSREITFHLKKPFADFDHLAALPQTAPVPEDRDGADYATHPISSGPYAFKGSFDLDGGSVTLVRNPHWSRAVDPHRSALPDEFVIDMGRTPRQVRDAAVAGEVDIVLGEVAAAAAARRVQKDGRPVDVSTTELRYATINAAFDPLGDRNCRRAVAQAIDHTSLRGAYEREGLGGETATTMLPPGIPGRQAFDPFETATHPTGDLVAARQSLAACGRPAGFRFTIAYEKGDGLAADAIGTALRRVGIRTERLVEDASDGDGLEKGKCSSRSWLRHNHVGMCMYSWSPDWQDGYGFLAPLVDSSARSADGTSYNFSVRDSDIDGLIDQALASSDPAGRDALWSEVDRRVVEEARFVPGVYVDRLLVQPPNLTNLWVNPTYGAYDYAAVGVVGGAS